MSERKSPPPARARLRLGQPPVNTMPKPNISPPRICPAQLRLAPARYIDLSSATTPPACSSWAPTSAVAPARIQARNRRQSPKLWMSLSEPMAQKLVANTTAPNRQPITSPPSASQTAPFCAMVSRSASIIVAPAPLSAFLPSRGSPLPSGISCETWTFRRMSRKRRIFENRVAAIGGRGRQFVTRYATRDALLPSRAGQKRGAAQVVDREDGHGARGVAEQRGVARPRQAVEALGRAEHSLHRRPPPCDQSVALLLPARQLRYVLVAAMHDAVLDARRLQPRPSLLLLVGLVGIDRRLVAADQSVSNLAVV